MDHLIPARRPNLILINMKRRTCNLMDFGVPADHRVKTEESKNIDKYLDLGRDTNSNLCTWNGPQSLVEKTR